jgi:hypothetical protein
LGSDPENQNASNPSPMQGFDTHGVPCAELVEGSARTMEVFIIDISGRQPRKHLRQQL